MNKEITYLSGPMSGVDKYNFPKFNKVAETLRNDHDLIVINPAEEIGGNTEPERNWFLRGDLMKVIQADSITFLPGWHTSDGAKMEAYVAKELGKDLYRFVRNEREKITKIDFKVSRFSVDEDRVW